MSQSAAYKTIRAICVLLGAIAALAMAIVTVVAEKTNNASAVFVAMPGIICHLLITGGHGGTQAQEVAGFTIAICVNALMGGLLFSFVLAVLKRCNDD